MNKFSARILMICLILTSINLKAQENFRVGDFLEISNDSITVAFNSMGGITSKKRADFIRKGKRDQVFMNVAGDFKDYDKNGNLFFKGTMLDNYLNGEATYYYSNGTIKEEGNFKNDIRGGLWKFYHSDGTLARLVLYDNGEMTIKEAYSKNGKQIVKDGNGKTMIHISRFRQSRPYEASGMLKNGKLDGRWQLFTPELGRTLANEIFENGKFVKGESVAVMGNDTYTDHPSIVLSMFYPNEAVDFSNGSTSYPLGVSFFPWEFNGKLPEKKIYQMLLDSIIGKYKKPIADQWIIIGFRINKDDSISDINISSSSHDQNLNRFLCDVFAKSTGWKSSVINGKKESSDIFFSVVMKDKKILFPAYFKDITATKLDKTWERILPELPAYDSVISE